MAAISEIEIGSYRGLKDLKVTDFLPAGQVNAIRGKCGGGKTSFLEAIAISINRHDARFLWNEGLHRGMDVKADPIADLADEEIRTRVVEYAGSSRKSGDDAFYAASFEDYSSVTDEYQKSSRASTDYEGEANFGVRDVELPVGAVKIRADWEAGGANHFVNAKQVVTRGGVVSIPATRPNDCVFLDSRGVIKQETKNRFSGAVLAGHKQDVESAMNACFGIMEANVAQTKDGMVLYLGNGESAPRPAGSWGGGVANQINAFAALYAAECGVICIDNVNSGMSNSDFRAFLEQIVLACGRMAKQAFITVSDDAYDDCIRDNNLIRGFWIEGGEIIPENC